MAARDLEFSCSCGGFAGHITEEARKSGLRLLCHCADCRAAELFHGQADPTEGVDLFQLAPDGIVITKGAEHLRLLRLSPKGLHRWYTGCCGTPFANTLAKPQLAFAGMRSDLFADKSALGKIKAHANIPQPGKPPRSKGMFAMVFGIFSWMLAARLSGRWRQTPFFDIETGAPVAEAEIPSKEARAQLYR